MNWIYLQEFSYYGYFQSIFPPLLRYSGDLKKKSDFIIIFFMLVVIWFRNQTCNDTLFMCLFLDLSIFLSYWMQSRGWVPWPATSFCSVDVVYSSETCADAWIEKEVRMWWSSILEKIYLFLLSSWWVNDFN